MVSTFSAVAKQPCSRITCTVLFFIHLTLLPLLVAFLFLVFQELMRCVLCGGPTKNSVWIEPTLLERCYLTAAICIDCSVKQIHRILLLSTHSNLFPPIIQAAPPSSLPEACSGYATQCGWLRHDLEHSPVSSSGDDQVEKKNLLLSWRPKKGRNDHEPMDCRARTVTGSWRVELMFSRRIRFDFSFRRFTCSFGTAQNGRKRIGEVAPNHGTLAQLLARSRIFDRSNEHDLPLGRWEWIDI